MRNGDSEMNIKIEYDGCYPNLCSGQLIVYIDNEKYVFPRYCMNSGGNVWFDDDWSENVSEGPWDITEWPEDFPEHLKSPVLAVVNSEIEWGCCGGCV